MFPKAIFFCSAWCMLFLQINCWTINDANNLTEYLFAIKKYNNKLVPRFNQSDAVEVNVTLRVLSIDGLSEATETFKATGYLYISWKDEFLTWNETNFGGLNYYLWPQANVWKPDMALLNSYEDYKQMGDKSLLVYVLADGTVNWYPYQVFQSTCSVDILYFPFDIQTCDLNFGAWSYTDEVVTRCNGTALKIMTTDSNPEWEIRPLGCSEEDMDGTYAVKFSLQLKRKPLYVLLTLFMPMIMLYVLNIFVFILPCESGEKAGYAITVFLAFAVFLTIVSSTMPRSSDTIAIFSVFLILLTIQSTLITTIALMLIRCYSFEDQDPIPKGLYWFLRIFCLVTTKTKVRPAQDKKLVESTARREISGRMTEIIEIKCNKKNDGKLVDKQKHRAGMDTWKGAVKKLDKFCLIFFSLTFLVSLAVCTYIAKHTSDHLRRPS